MYVNTLNLIMEMVNFSCTQNIPEIESVVFLRDNHINMFLTYSLVPHIRVTKKRV